MKAVWMFIRVMFALALGCEAQAGEISIGMVAPLTGPAAVYGKEASAGVKAYIDHVNQTGGVAGNRIKLILRDDGFKPDETVNQVRQLVDDGVVGFVSGAGAANWDAVVKSGILQEHSVPVVGVITAASFLREPQYGNLFFVRPTVRSEIRRMLEQLKSMGFTRFAVLYQDDSFGKDALQGVAEESVRMHLQQRAAGHKRDASDVPQVVKELLATQPQALVLLGASNAAGLAVKSARQAGFTGQILGMSVIDPRNVVAIAGADASRGVGLIQVMPNPRSALKPVSLEFQRLVDQSQGASAVSSTLAMEGFIAAKVIVEAIRRAGRKPQANQVYRALIGTPFDVGGFSIRFDNTNRTGSVAADLAIMDSRGLLLY